MLWALQQAVVVATEEERVERLCIGLGELEHRPRERLQHPTTLTHLDCARRDVERHNIAPGVLERESMSSGAGSDIEDTRT